MNRIGTDHLARRGDRLCPQSTVGQVINNVESRRRQYALVDRARQLGWANVSVIDDDLGRSGSGVARPGFEKLLAAICEAASRRGVHRGFASARNGVIGIRCSSSAVSWGR